ncbi:MAG: hypothetical protein HFI26_16725 [Lachnospiraceae bacterium]|nr:hypothetical protein [Lachnospiraceae bacterium]
MKELTIRFGLFFIGINLLAAGIILNTRSNLGVAAFTSFYYALSEISHMSLGSSSIIVYFVLITIQIILARKLSLSVALQIPFSIIFGIITDIYDYMLPEPELSLLGRFFMLSVAIWLTSIGVYLYTNCRLVMTPVEGTVQTIADRAGLRFSLVKNGFDLTMLLLTILFCLLLKQPIFGIGIGTVVSALLLGRIIGIYEKKISFLFRYGFKDGMENGEIKKTEQ